MQNLYFLKTYWNNQLSLLIIDYPWQLEHDIAVFNLIFEILLE